MKFEDPAKRKAESEPQESAAAFRNELAGQSKPATPYQTAQSAFDEFQKTGKLTPNMDKRFNDAIKTADQTPSPRVPELEKKVTSLRGQLDKLYPQSSKEEVERLGQKIQIIYEQLPPDKKAEVELVRELRKVASDKDMPSVNDRMKQVSPEILEHMLRISDLQKPAVPTAEKLEAAKTSLAREKSQASVTRVLYGMVLLQSGKDNEARKQVTDAVNKDESILADEEFAEVASAVGLDVAALRRK